MMISTDFLSTIEEESEIEIQTVTPPIPPPRNLKKEIEKEIEEKPRAGFAKEFIQVYNSSPIASAKTLRRNYRHTKHDQNSNGFTKEISEHLAIFTRKMVTGPPIISIAFSEVPSAIKCRLIWRISDFEIDNEDANLALVDLKILWGCFDSENRQIVTQLHVPINTMNGIEESRSGYDLMKFQLAREPLTGWLLLENLYTEKK